MPTAIVVEKGERYGRLTVIKETTRGRSSSRPRRFRCRCDCGNKCDVHLFSLRSGRTQSCGCYHSERIAKHRMANTPLYWCYKDMVKRCVDPEVRSYAYYGGRGIKVCKAWLKDKTKFFDWALANGYAEGLEIDRIDNDKDYSPSNCRWVTRKQNQRNRRNNRIVKVKGESMCLAEAVERHSPKGVTSSHVIRRLDRGWTLKQALLTPTSQPARIK